MNKSKINSLLKVHNRIVLTAGYGYITIIFQSLLLMLIFFQAFVPVAVRFTFLGA